MIVTSVFVGTVYDAATGKVLSYRKVLAAGPRPGSIIHYGEFSPDGSRVLLPMMGNPEVWDTKTWQKLDGIVRWPAQHAAFGSTGDIVSAGSDGAVRQWGQLVGADKSLWNPLRHGAAVHHVAVSLDGRLAVSAATDFTARVWHLPSATPLGPTFAHAGSLHFAAFSPEGRYLATAGEDGVVRLWDLAMLWPADRALAEEDTMHEAFDREGKRAFGHVFHQGKPPMFRPELRVSEPSSGRILQRHALDTGISNFACSEDGSRIATVDLKGQVRFWAADPLNSVAIAMEPPMGSCIRLAFSDDGRRVLSIMNRSELRGKDLVLESRLSVWDWETGKTLHSVVSKHPFTHAAFRRDGELVAACGSEGAAYVWKIGNAEPIVPPMRHSDKIVQVEFAPDGDRLLTAGHDRSARVWNLKSGEPSTPPLSHSDDLLFAHFSPDGTKIVSGGYDRSVRIWNSETGLPTSAPLMHADGVLSARFSPDGRWLATQTSQHLRVWESAGGTPMTPSWKSHLGQVKEFRFNSDSEGLSIRFRDGTTTTWNLRPLNRNDADMPDTAMLLSGTKFDSTGAAMPLTHSELKKLWGAHRTSFPKTDEAAWLRNEAADSKTTWHLDRLLALAPNRNAYLRRAALRAAAGNQDDADADRAAANVFRKK
ncbi:MAG: WD40 repeat domain-containing protein [Gemmataceae bacterium]